jgi:hypothetical protein
MRRKPTTGDRLKMLELLPDAVSDDTVECLTSLLARAKTGEVTGIAFAVILRRRRYTVNTCGAARKYPTFTRGMIRALDDELGEIIRKPKS